MLLRCRLWSPLDCFLTVVTKFNKLLLLEFTYINYWSGLLLLQVKSIISIALNCFLTTRTVLRINRSGGFLVYRGQKKKTHTHTFIFMYSDHLNIGLFRVLTFCPLFGLSYSQQSSLFFFLNSFLSQLLKLFPIFLGNISKNYMYYVIF